MVDVPMSLCIQQLFVVSIPSKTTRYQSHYIQPFALFQLVLSSHTLSTCVGKPEILGHQLTSWQASAPTRRSNDSPSSLYIQSATPPTAYLSTDSDPVSRLHREISSACSQAEGAAEDAHHLQPPLYPAFEQAAPSPAQGGDDLPPARLKTLNPVMKRERIVQQQQQQQ